jgi:hypothetical protein
MARTSIEMIQIADFRTGRENQRLRLSEAEMCKWSTLLALGPLSPVLSSWEHRIGSFHPKLDWDDILFGPRIRNASGSIGGVVLTVTMPDPMAASNHSLRFVLKGPNILLSIC